MTRLQRVVYAIADRLIGHRHLLSLVFAAMTLAFGYSATKVRLDPGFLKLIPVKHEYMQTMMDYLQDFSGANTVLVNLHWRGEGDIYNPEFMEAMRKATDDVFFIPGINRTHVSSIFTPNVYYIEITEDGFRGEPVVPARYSGTPEQLANVRRNVEHSGQIGQLVANDLKGAMIRADLQDYDAAAGPDGPQRVDYWEVQNRLEEIRGRIENPKKYVYRLKVDHAPFKAGDIVHEGYVNQGLLGRFQTIKATHKAEDSDNLDIIPLPASELAIETVPNPEYSANIEVNIIGFARLLGDVIKGLLGVFAFFGLAFAITLVLLYRYSRSLRLTAAATVVALLPVLWLIGVLPLIGFGIDPMSILVPFLVFSIGVSHAVQMTSAWRREVVAGADAVTAARTAFCTLFVPGAVALLTNALGFAVIMLIDIPIVRELGITACTGVLLMIITNKMILPILLTHVRLEDGSRRHSLRIEAQQTSRFTLLVARCAQPRVAAGVLVASLVLLAGSTVLSRGLVIGDSGRGVPELRKDSRYNRDSERIASSYDIGVDVLSVIVEAKGFDGDSCLHYEVTSLVDRLELYTRGIAGVQSVVSVGSIGKLVIGAFNEGNPRWRALPRTEAGLSAGSKAFDPNNGLNNESCRAIQVYIFMKDHEGATIAHVIRELKTFIAANPVEGVKLRLASGNVGVMAATNEAVEEAEVRMLLAIFGALILLCFLTFRSWRAVLCVIVPLTMVSIFCNALMASLGIGLKVATLPVIALGVGVGVDYGIYLFEQIQHAMHDPRVSFAQAFERAMRQRGSAAVFTAITMAVAVGTWTLSALKYQADMGLLLSFMFLVNMLGAICLLPALGAFFFGRAQPAEAALEAPGAKPSSV